MTLHCLQCVHLKTDVAVEGCVSGVSSHLTLWVSVYQDCNHHYIKGGRARAMWKRHGPPNQGVFKHPCGQQDQEPI